MEDARREDTERIVVQAHRFELIDEAGRVRAILGDILDTKSYGPGLALLDRQGHHRANYALAPWGPTLTFSLGGNDVLVLAVNDDGFRDDAEEYDPQTTMMLCDGGGTPRIGFTVCQDGETDLIWEG
jgi:hypothetical protein